MTAGCISEQAIAAEDILALQTCPDVLIQRILRRLKRQGIKPGEPVMLSAIAPGDRGIFIAAARRARQTGDGSANAGGDPLWSYLRAGFTTCRKNAAKRGIPFDMTSHDLRALYKRAGGCCEVTGVTFSTERFGSARAPFSPSIDRIDSAGGYHSANVRLTCQIANLAMNVWGDSVLHEFVRRITRKPNPK